MYSLIKFWCNFSGTSRQILRLFYHCKLFLIEIPCSLEKQEPTLRQECIVWHAFDAKLAHSPENCRFKNLDPTIQSWGQDRAHGTS